MLRRIGYTVQSRNSIYAARTTAIRIQIESKSRDNAFSLSSFPFLYFFKKIFFCGYECTHCGTDRRKMRNRNGKLLISTSESKRK